MASLCRRADRTTAAPLNLSAVRCSNCFMEFIPGDVEADDVVVRHDGTFRIGGAVKFAAHRKPCGGICDGDHIDDDPISDQRQLTGGSAFRFIEMNETRRCLIPAHWVTLNRIEAAPQHAVTVVPWPVLVEFVSPRWLVAIPAGILPHVQPLCDDIIYKPA
jgi:hypothetical protein